MSESVPSALWYLVGFVATTHVALPLLLRDLRLQYPTIFSGLGNPKYTQVFSRYPGHWRVQLRILRFLASGEALRTTKGRARVFASVAVCACAGTLLSLVALGVTIFRS